MRARVVKLLRELLAELEADNDAGPSTIWTEKCRSGFRVRARHNGRKLSLKTFATLAEAHTYAATVTPTTIAARASAARTKEVSRVYFIQAADHIKIGRAVDINRRMYAIRCHNHDPIYLVGSVPGGAAKERELHRELQSEHVHGEWFAASPKTKAVIARELGTP